MLHVCFSGRDFGVGGSNGAISGLTKFKMAAHIPDMFLIIKLCTFITPYGKFEEL